MSILWLLREPRVLLTSSHKELSELPILSEVEQGCPGMRAALVLTLDGAATFTMQLQPCIHITTLDSTAKQLQQDTDVKTSVTTLENFISCENLRTFCADLTDQVFRLLTKTDCQQGSTVHCGQSVSGPTLLSTLRGQHKAYDSVSLEFVEESVKCFLHQLLYPSCPSRVNDPEYFIQGILGPNPCMAMATHDYCSGLPICLSQALGETVDLLMKIIMNQVMEAFSPAPAQPSTKDIESGSGLEVEDNPSGETVLGKEEAAESSSVALSVEVVPSKTELSTLDARAGLRHFEAWG